MSKDMSEVEFNSNLAIARMLEAQEDINVRLERMKWESEERIREMEEQHRHQFERMCEQSNVERIEFRNELLRRDAALLNHRDCPQTTGKSNANSGTRNSNVTGSMSRDEDARAIRKYT